MSRAPFPPAIFWLVSLLALPTSLIGFVVGCLWRGLVCGFLLADKIREDGNVR